MTLLLFGITREIVGTDRLPVPAEAGIRDVAGLKAWLAGAYPGLGALRSLAVAVNQEYAADEQPLSEVAEIALIPPVSGG